MSIENQATFWLRNVCDLSAESYNVIKSSDVLIEGMEEFNLLLKTIYNDYQSYEVSTVESVRTKIGIMADDLENYHNLTDTLEFLYRMVSIGVLQTDGGINYLQIDKVNFRKEFKKSTSFMFDILETYSFYFKYYKRGEEITKYKACDTFCLYYDNSNSIILAMKHLIERLPITIVKDDYAPSKNIFFIADFDGILSKNSTKQKDIHPLKTGIVRTIGSLGELWFIFVEYLCNQLNLTTVSLINPFVFPNWTVRFQKQKKTICTFFIQPDSLYIRLPLSYEMAKEVILSRDQLPDSISESINCFECCGCKKCVDQSNIEIFEGVRLCKLQIMNFVTEDSRCIRLAIKSHEEVSAICNIIQTSLTR